MQTNNTLYEKKHHYMFILKELTILKNQTEHEVLEEGLPKVYSQEIKDLYTRVIVGLLEEGVKYQYVKDSSDSKKDIISMKIDGNTYECRNIDVREILEDRYEEIMHKNYQGPSLREINKLRSNNQQQPANDVKNLLLGIKDAIHENNENNNSEKKEPEKLNYTPPKVYIPDSEPLYNTEHKSSKWKINVIHILRIIAIIAALIIGFYAANTNPTIKGFIETTTNKVKVRIENYINSDNDNSSGNSENNEDIENYKIGTLEAD